MIPVNFKEIRRKNADSLLKNYGLLYSFIAAMSILLFFTNGADLIESNSIDINKIGDKYGIWIIILPFITLIIGVGFFVIGKLYDKLSTKRLIYYSILLSILILIMIPLIIVSSDYLRIFITELTEYPDFFKYVFYVFFGLMALGTYFLFIHPQFIILNKILNDNRNGR